MPLLLALLFIGLFIALSAWQWQRAEEKTQELQHFKQSEHPVLSLLTPEDLRHPAGQPVRLQLILDQTQHFLLDNRTRRGLAGYELLIPATTDDGLRLLVNLGWLPAPAQRSRLPSIRLSGRPVLVSGRLLPLTDTPLLKPDRWRRGWPKRIQAIDLSQLQRVTGLHLPSAILRLSQPVFPALDTHWPPPRMSPERHRGYAIQWLALAITVALLALYYLYRLHREP